jgi:hypothetical protein
VPQVYSSENQSGYPSSAALRDEVDYSRPERRRQVSHRHDGNGGVLMNPWLRAPPSRPGSATEPADSNS